MSDEDPGPNALRPTARAQHGWSRPTPSDPRRFRLTVVAGPGRGAVWESTGGSCSIGSHPSNDLSIDHPTVSRFHCELHADGRRVRVRDLDSRNGTVVDGVLVRDAFLRSGLDLHLGEVVLRFELGVERNHLPASDRSELGELVGRSAAMRGVFAVIERAAATDATVLIEGETGTGKSLVARTLHSLSDRADRPFLTLDCGAIPAQLLESELFGHRRGAFTGAAEARTGLFEEASGGTVFLDEIGELPAELQPKLLRVIEEREVRPVGENSARPIDVRIVAATNRDLRLAVNSGRFRSDLFYRLAVVRLTILPLRRRPEDIAPTALRILDTLGSPEATASLRTRDFLTGLEGFAWPGNVRELRNHLERCLVFHQHLPASDDGFDSAPAAIDLTLPYAEARQRAQARFEHDYLVALLDRHDRKVADAADAAGLDRAYLYRLLRRHHIKP